MDSNKKYNINENIVEKIIITPSSLLNTSNMDRDDIKKSFFTFERLCFRKIKLYKNDEIIRFRATGPQSFLVSM